jgi:hypothetical protein
VQVQSSTISRSEQAARQAQHMVDAAFATDEQIHLFVVPDKPGELPAEMTASEVSFSRDQRDQAIRWTKIALRARWAVFRSATKAAPPEPEPELPDFDFGPPAHRATKPSGRGIGIGDEPPSKYRKINDRAMANFPKWVPALFGKKATKTGEGGYRVSSKALGRDLQEDLSIAPEGIVDFGIADMGDPREGRRPPLDVIIEYGGLGLDLNGAFRWLSEKLDNKTEEPGGDKPKASANETQSGLAIVRVADVEGKKSIGFGRGASRAAS